MENSTSSKENGHTIHYATGWREAKQSLVELYRKEKKIIRSLDLVVRLQMHFMEEAALELPLRWMFQFLGSPFQISSLL